MYYVNKKRWPKFCSFCEDGRKVKISLEIWSPLLPTNYGMKSFYNRFTLNVARIFPVYVGNAYRVNYI